MTSESSTVLVETIALVARTLLVNGYYLLKVNRDTPGSATLRFRKHQRLGGECNYLLLLAISHVSPNVLTAFQREARRSACTPLVVGHVPTASGGQYTLDSFLQMLGGAVDHSTVLKADLPALLNTVGHNQPYNGLEGRNDDILEEYVKACLQYLLSCPARRFGQDRRFESVPDGVALGPSGLNIYFDAKAYANGFSISLDDIKRFGSYVADFNQRYAPMLGPIYSFLVVSGHFTQDKESLQNKSDQLYERCNTKMSVLTAEDLGRITCMFHEKGAIRTSVNWKALFSQLMVSPRAVENEVARLCRDGLAVE